MTGRFFELKSSTKSTFLRSTKSRFSQVYVSGFDEVDRVMILEETNIYSIYIKLLYIIIYNNSIIQVLNNPKTFLSYLNK